VLEFIKGCRTNVRGNNNFNSNSSSNNSNNNNNNNNNYSSSNWIQSVKLVGWKE